MKKKMVISVFMLAFLTLGMSQLAMASSCDCAGILAIDLAACDMYWTPGTAWHQRCVDLAYRAYHTCLTNCV